MMMLISLAIIVAFGTSLAATFGLFEIDVWWEVASLITIMVLGHWLEMRAISQARGALNALAALLPDPAERVRGAETQMVALSENLMHGHSVLPYLDLETYRIREPDSVLTPALNCLPRNC